ncbi:MAG: hypothetical protein RMK84_09735 [Oscillochloridaceae bacterium]|nr:hypothetical protein [Chloroflexaceae bacterium]MDW8390396.1 hypothetical protein [Oscillochloridaceae bacterium]
MERASRALILLPGRGATVRALPAFTPGRCSGGIYARVAAALLCWSIVTIALVNPLLCLVHCAMSERHAALSAEQRHFLCDLGDTDAGRVSGPFAAVWSGPRAVYEALPLPATALVIVVALVGILVAAPLTARQHAPLRDRPPPKAPFRSASAMAESLSR